VAGLHSYVVEENHAKDLPPKFIFVVSKKVAKKAVDRNRIKRRARAISHEVAKLLSSRTYKLYFNKSDLELSYSELKKKIHDFLHL